MGNQSIYNHLCIRENLEGHVNAQGKTHAQKIPDKNRNRFTYIENKLVVTSGERGKMG